ncbi:membrane protein [Rhodococcus pyridinivorans KG-16]|jgi:putative Ca2+/H+ antiporter (TMEM165/GDT1 family)|uniref:GDT1 family protein n=1 Tax=Rhodococcus pyridinivorans KG-16 TaxID=1441730 RepID=A0A0V9UJL9_9NOCA|nr:TMEM165/GDT1 family protein [Rhodococcus pyridinivorans]KSZ58196.1 membrane protein [Rhodococcus pyridinivorans KG-16]
MWSALVLSFAVVFVAELGDKSQLMAMTFALRYRWWVVLSGILFATTAVHLVSVAVGHYLGVAIPATAISIVGGIAFLIFGAWTLRGDSLDDDEQSKAGRVARSAFLAVTSAFFLAELGDKTMLATITLATDNNWAGVWIGSTVGMVAADALAIVIGAVLGRHLPDNAIRYGAAALFFGFGAWMVGDGLFPETGAVGPIAGAVALLLSVAVMVVVRRRSRRVAEDESPALMRP